jgi:hypothetical protein
MSTFLVEQYWPGITAETFQDAAKRVRDTTEQMTAEGVQIDFLHSTLVLGDEAAFCVFEAESQTAVEQAYARAGVEFDRVLDALQIATRGTDPSRNVGLTTAEG